MALKQMKVGPLPPDIEENRNASTRLESLHLTQRTERELRNSGFVTAGQVASRSREELEAPSSVFLSASGGPFWFSRTKAEDRKSRRDLLEFRERSVLVHGHVRSRSRGSL